MLPADKTGFPIFEIASSFWIEKVNYTYINIPLKELYTSETTLAQKIVLASLINEFVLEIRYSTPIMQKNPQTFLAKISKVPFRAVLALWCINTKISKT